MKISQLLLSIPLLLLASARALAQCPVPDGLNFGLPCNGAQATVRELGFVQPALGICFKDCGVTGTSNYTARWSVTNPFYGGVAAPSCAWFVIGLQLFQGPNLRWVGRFHMTYSRTWTESKAPGQQYQVWRYLVNGDMRPTSTASLPCGLPSCIGAFGGNMRVTGYVDYARDCASGMYERAWMLTHACDSVDHAAGYPRAGVFHPDRYFSFVGPSWGFIPGAGATVESGALSKETLRRWAVPVLPARCTVEETLVAGSIAPSPSVCLCGVGPANWHQGSFMAAGSAGTTITPFPGSDPFRSFPVGRWTLPLSFPGVEEVRWNSNEAQWVECTGVARNEYYFGVTTAGGFPAMSWNPGTPSMPLPLIFLDQANSAILPGGVATRNQPYRSDHIINANL